MSATGSEQTNFGIALDSTASSLFIAGQTASGLAGANAGGSDVFVAKVDTSTGNLTWIKQMNATYSGLITSAAGSETAYHLGIDSSNNVYVSGLTSGSFGAANGGGMDAFLTKIDGSTGTLTWVKQVVTSFSGFVVSAAGNDSARGFHVDSNGNSCLIGDTSGSLFGTNGGSNDIFVACIDSTGSM